MEHAGIALLPGLQGMWMSWCGRRQAVTCKCCGRVCSGCGHTVCVCRWQELLASSGAGESGGVWWQGLSCAPVHALLEVEIVSLGIASGGRACLR